MPPDALQLCVDRDGYRFSDGTSLPILLGSARDVVAFGADEMKNRPDAVFLLAIDPETPYEKADQALDIQDGFLIALPQATSDEQRECRGTGVDDPGGPQIRLGVRNEPRTIKIAWAESLERVKDRLEADTDESTRSIDELTHEHRWILDLVRADITSHIADVQRVPRGNQSLQEEIAIILTRRSITRSWAVDQQIESGRMLRPRIGIRVQT